MCLIKQINNSKNTNYEGKITETIGTTLVKNPTITATSQTINSIADAKDNNTMLVVFEINKQ